MYLCARLSEATWWLKTVSGASLYFKWLRLFPQWVCRTSILLFSPFTNSNRGFTDSVFSILLHWRPICTRLMSLELFLYYLYWSVILIHSPPRPPQHESWIWSHFAKLVPLKRARFSFLLVMQMYRETTSLRLTCLICSWAGRVGEASQRWVVRALSHAVDGGPVAFTEPLLAQISSIFKTERATDIGTLY